MKGRCFLFRTRVGRRKGHAGCAGAIGQSRCRGLVVPKISLWWNERFNTLQTSLRRGFAEIANTEVCDLYDLRRRPAGPRLRRADRHERSGVGEDVEVTAADRVLPPPVPPDSGERRLVG